MRLETHCVRPKKMQNTVKSNTVSSENIAKVEKLSNVVKII